MAHETEDSFVCDACGETFLKPKEEWSEEMAEAEANTMFGPIPKEEQAIVCHDCFQRMAKMFGWDLPTTIN